MGGGTFVSGRAWVQSPLGHVVTELELELHGANKGHMRGCSTRKALQPSKPLHIALLGPCVSTLTGLTDPTSLVPEHWTSVFLAVDGASQVESIVLPGPGPCLAILFRPEVSQ